MEEIKESNFASVKLINDYDTLFVKYFNEEVFDKNEALKIAVNRNQLYQFNKLNIQCLIINSKDQTLNFRPFSQETNCRVYLINKYGLWCIGRNARTKISSWN